MNILFGKISKLFVVALVFSCLAFTSVGVQAQMHPSHAQRKEQAHQERVQARKQIRRQERAQAKAQAKALRHQQRVHAGHAHY